MDEVYLLESCTSTWIFDTSARRFRRIPTGSRLDGSESAFAWTSYDRLEVEAGHPTFAVILDPMGTRVLRSWIHHDPCDRCGPKDAGHRPFDEMRRAIRQWQLRLGAVVPAARPGDAETDDRPAARRIRAYGGR